MKEHYEGLIARLVWDGTDEVRIPPELGTPNEGQMVGTASERLAEIGGRTCYDPETEILTRDGWVRFDQLQRGVEVATVNPKTGEMEFQEPTDYIEKRHVGKMYRVKTTKVSIFVTPDHNLYASDLKRCRFGLVRADEMAGKPFLVQRHAAYESSAAEPIIMKGRSYQQKHNRNASKIVTRTVADEIIDIHQLPAWASLLGWYVSEGSLNMKEGAGSAPVVSIYQKKENVGPIMEAAERCGLRPRISNIDKRNGVAAIHVGGSTLAHYLKQFGLGSRNKRLPAYVFEWPRELREHLLDALMAGDGTTTENKVRVYNTNSKGLADDVQRLIVGLGRPANINHSEDKTCHMYRIRETAHRLASVNKHRRQDAWVDYDGMVHCVTVPNGVLLTRRDEKIVACGNCYDSLGAAKSRSSKDYHPHIREVKHTSVNGHHHFTVAIPVGPAMNYSPKTVVAIYQALMNRPGIWLNTRNPEFIRVTTNLRAVTEWHKWSKRNERYYDGTAMQAVEVVGTVLNRAGKKVAPQIVTDTIESGLQYLGIRDNSTLVEPEDDSERWITLYVEGSRGFSHELVRHGYQTGISQRSTRYVDEDESPWVMHPLIQEFLIDETQNPEDRAKAKDVIAEAELAGKKCYGTLVKILQPFAKSRIKDDPYAASTARKQARGASRGYLGNALKTAIIFSAAVEEWKWILGQRAANAADGEIRCEFSQEVIPELKKSRYAASFAGFEVEPAVDGVGYALKGGGNK